MQPIKCSSSNNTATKAQWLRGADRKKCCSKDKLKHISKQLDIPIFYGNTTVANKSTEVCHYQKKKVVLKTDFQKMEIEGTAEIFVMLWK